MPRRISQASLRKAHMDWKKSYNDKKSGILNFLNERVQKGGAIKVSGETYDNIQRTAEKLTKTTKNIIGTSLLGRIVRLLLVIILIFLSYVIIYGSYKKYVEKSPEYRDLDLATTFAKSFRDFFINLYSIYIAIVKLFGITEEKSVEGEREVYLLGNNNYTYDEAKQACSLLDGKLATRSQVKAAYNKGAEWCNYGWSEGQEALYPTQDNTYRMLKKAGRDNECGTPGVNGGYFPDKEMRFGVNCYGVKPSPERDNLLKVDCSDPKVVQLLDVVTGQYGINYTCPKEMSMENRPADLSMDGLFKNIMPFSNYSWSKESQSNNLYVGDNTISRNAKGYYLKEGFADKCVIDKEKIKKALKEIKTYLGNKLMEDLKKSIGKSIEKSTRMEIEKEIVNVCLNKIMEIFKKNGIPRDNQAIEDAIRCHGDYFINQDKRDIDYILTPAGIRGIYARLKKMN